jgi:hypothetical protein
MADPSAWAGVALGAVSLGLSGWVAWQQRGQARDQQRLAEAQADAAARQQASQVWVTYTDWGGAPPDSIGDPEPGWGATVFNGSDAPIYDVAVVVDPRGAATGAEDYLPSPDPMAPGERQSVDGEGRPGVDVVEVWFRDAAGNSWARSAEGWLRRNEAER